MTNQADNGASEMSKRNEAVARFHDRMARCYDTVGKPEDAKIARRLAKEARENK